METAIEYCDGACGGKVYVSSDERWCISRLRRLKEKCPDEVEIVVEPEENDGCICAKIPRRWMRKFGPGPKGRELTEEEKNAARERLLRYREAQKLDRKKQRQEGSVETVEDFILTDEYDDLNDLDEEVIEENDDEEESVD